MKLLIITTLILLIGSYLSTSTTSSTRSKSLTKSSLDLSLNIENKINNKLTRSLALTSSSTTLQRYLNRFRFPLTVKNTKEQWYGSIQGGQTKFLSKHVVNCGIGALSQIKYMHRKQSNKWRRFRYQFGCVQPPSTCTKVCKTNIKNLDAKACKVYFTKQNSLGNWDGFSTTYLNRHHIKCPSRNVLTMFKQLTNNNSRTIKYKFKCCPAKTSNCKTFDTNKTNYDNNSTHGLSNQMIKVPNVNIQALTGFQLKVDEGSHKWWYRVEYCNIAG